jgi:hypothetical protein
MSFLLNLNNGLSHILPRLGKDKQVHFEIRVNNRERGDKDLPEYFGMCYVTPKFLRDLRKLCEKHRCGER